MAAIFRNYDQAELDRQYDQGTLVPKREIYNRRNRDDSARMKATLSCELDIAYGSTPDELLDVFPNKIGGAPVQVLIHGGAWTRGHKDAFAFPASVMVPANVVLVVPNFSLAPAVSLDEMVRQNRAAIGWVYRNISRFGGDPDRIYVTGFSSGGHLAAMMAVTNWQQELGLPPTVLKGATLLSGIYDLEPVQLSYRNDYLHLDQEAVGRLSPVYLISKRTLPIVIGFGENELPEFQRQSREMAAACRAHGYPVAELSLPGHNHFEVLRTLASPNSPTFEAMMEMMGQARSYKHDHRIMKYFLVS